MEKILEKVFFAQTSLAELGEDGYWRVTSDVEQAFLPLNGEWDCRRISVMSIDKVSERAYKTASEAVNRKFEQLEFNLFNLPKEESTNGYENPVNDYKAGPSEPDSP
jgi:hypothetical protein